MYSREEIYKDTEQGKDRHRNNEKKERDRKSETMVKEIYRETDTGIDGQRNKRKRSREI